MRCILKFIWALFFVSALNADQMPVIISNYENGVTNGLGAGGSVHWTWGFIYRRHFANGFGFSTSLGGLFDGDRGHVGNTLGLLYTVAHHQFSWSSLPEASMRVYLAAYLANIYLKEKNYQHKKDHPDTFITRHIWDMGAGAGPGIEFFFSRNFSLHAELPWMTFARFADKKVSFKNSFPHFGGGFIYCF